MATSFPFWSRVLAFFNGLSIPTFDKLLPRPLPDRRILRYSLNVAPGGALQTQFDLNSGQDPAIIPPDEVWSVEYVTLTSSGRADRTSWGNVLAFFPGQGANGRAMLESTMYNNGLRVPGAQVPTLVVHRNRRSLLESGDVLELSVFTDPAEVGAVLTQATIVVYRWPRGMCPYLS